MPYECFSKCYDALVQSIINYVAAVWGSTGYSCIAAVQNRACRYFMGQGKYAPNPAIQGDITIGNTRVSVAYYSFYDNIQLYLME